MGYLVSFATLGAGSSPSVPMCPRQVPALPCTLSPPDMSSPLLLTCPLPCVLTSLGVLPWGPMLHQGVWALLDLCRCQTEAWPHQAPGPVQSFLEVQAHHRALGTEGHGMLCPPAPPTASQGAHGECGSTFGVDRGSEESHWSPAPHPWDVNNCQIPSVPLGSPLAKNGPLHSPHSAGESWGAVTASRDGRSRRTRTAAGAQHSHHRGAAQLGLGWAYLGCPDLVWSPTEAPQDHQGPQQLP